MPWADVVASAARSPRRSESTSSSRPYSARAGTVRSVIDLRSDTSTRPTAGMRAAIAAADVGDEQRGEDPTVRALEGRAAAFLGQEAAVYVPTATMANQIALRILTQPGDELLSRGGTHTS